MLGLKVLIVDDETHARAAIRGILETNFHEVEICGEANSLPEAVKAIKKLAPNLIFLDIEMPGYLGIDLLDFFENDEIKFQIVFVTAYNEYAIKAFELAAVDYLLKPTRKEQLERALKRAYENTQHQLDQRNYFALKENLESREPRQLAFQTSEGLLLTSPTEILYLKADSSYTHLFFNSGNRITISKTLQEFNALEQTGLFFRINRSYLINVLQIEKIRKKDGGSVLLKNGEELSISMEKRQQLFDRFSQITF